MGVPKTIDVFLGELDEETMAEVLAQAFPEPKPKLLFLDDRSKRLHAAIWKYGDDYDVTLVATAKECIKMLSNEGPWKVISLDHDLCFEEFVNSNREDCGMEVVRWIERMKGNLDILWGSLFGKQTYVIIHTSNKSAALEMEIRLKALDIFASVRQERFTYDD